MKTTLLTPEEALAIARPLAEQVGAWLREQFRPWGVAAQAKADTSLITAADQEADQRLSAGLRAACPDLPVLSEESDTRWPVGAEAGWVVDPLDGTTNFAAGVPLWAVSVAYLVQGEPKMGVVHLPLLGWTAWATAGGGAWLGKRRLRVRPEGVAGRARIVWMCSRTARRRRVRSPWKARVSGCLAYDFLALALGQGVLVMGYSPKVWDLAAGWVIVQEAGGLWRPWAEGTLPFPLTQGMDYTRRPFPMLAAAGEQVLATMPRYVVPRK